MDSRVSVLIDIRSKLAGLEQATAGFGQLIKTVAGFAAAYLSVRTVVSQSREVLKLGADMDHLSARTGIAVPCQPSTLLIVKLQALVAMQFLEDSYFFLKILDNLLLMAVHPPG